MLITSLAARLESRYTNLSQGNYKVEEWNAPTSTYDPRDNLNIQITVEEVFDNHHKVVNRAGRNEGRFTFTAAEAGDHKICFAPSRAAVGGLMAGGQVQGTIKMTLDLAIGETSKIERTDKSKMSDLVGRVGDLKARLSDIRREQVFQRVSLLPSFTTQLVFLMVQIGARGRIQRPVRAHKLKGGSMDYPAACCPGRHVRLAVDPFEGVLHQTETYLILYAAEYGVVIGSVSAGTTIV